MGVDEVTIDSAVNSIGGSEVIIRGDNFTKWSKVFVNDEKVSSIYSSSNCLIIDRDSIADGDVITVCQMGSGNSVFRTSNTFIYSDPDAVRDTETAESSELAE